MTAGAMICGGMSSCKNADVDFPDSDGGINVYFAYQYPIRTIVLGDITTYDNTADNEHRFQIYSTMGGAYKGRNIDVDVEVDESLVNNLTLADGSPIKALPSNFYTLSGKTIHYNGSHQGCIDVQLSDAFFADEHAVENYYVVPLVMTGVNSGYNIKTGTPAAGSKNVRQNASDWIVAPMDYTLYMINFINKFDGSYLRRGIDDITTSAGTYHRVRHEKYIEYDSVAKVITKSLTSAIMPISIYDGTKPVTCDLLLTFNGDNCTITSATNGITATGTGVFKSKSEKKAWGDKDRDGLYLDYTVNVGSGVKYVTKDTLVVRDRGTAPSVREFKVMYNQQ